MDAERIATRPVLSEAFRRASLGKRGTPMVREFAVDLDARLSRIAHAILDGGYVFGPYHEFRVRDGKSRVIHAPPFEQRVVHHAMLLVTGPVLEHGAVPFSFACRKGLGHRKAIECARAHIRAVEWFLHVDIAAYYDSVSHAFLKAALERRFRERRLLGLFERLIDSYQARPGYGLPIGALTSQHLGNFFLDGIDHWALEGFGVSRYARYMDDLAAWGSYERLCDFRYELLRRLSALELQAKNGGNLNRCSQGMTFLGFTLRPSRMRLHRRGRKRLRLKLTALHRDFRKGRIDEKELQSHGTALFAWARQADDVEWRRAVLRRHEDFGDAIAAVDGSR